MDYGNVPQKTDLIPDRENLRTQNQAWDHTTPERDSRALGNKVISTPEDGSRQSDAPELGQITTAGMPPGYSEPELLEDTSSANNPSSDVPILKSTSFNRQNVMHGEHLSTKAIDYLKDDERELDATGDAAAFFNKFVEKRDQFQGKESA